ncbi:MAG: hypothetical protein CVV44_17260 [Spirochaetae bacterium HGW-Spirochaetae-1]|jgi:hypothetical protein|nr:MAG: hypothetical protein CVV44_17260 [Spirochaetae bacterium HGW-Spirochaetae-1]
MELIGRILRQFAKLRFKQLNLATIKDIPTKQFNKIIEELIDSGWKKIYVYNGFDAWIDYGKVKLKRQGIVLTFEWDNWTEGSIEGPHDVIEALGNERGYEVTHEWRWSEYDDN